jgi:hypothetical protein
MKRIPRNLGAVIKALYAARNKLRKAFPNLSFTLDGNLVGDIDKARAHRQSPSLSVLQLQRLDHDVKNAERLLK